jgi:flavin-dependent dehydrogenase/intein/homing endonuclease
MPKVAIVGAGFAGLAAANRLIESGIRPIIIEARQEPIATTTGGIADWWFNAIKMSYPDEVVAAKIRGVRLVSPDGNEAVVKSDKSVGAVLYPEAYLKYYIRKLKDEGAEFITPGHFVQIRGRELTYIKSGIEKVMTGVDYLIAADGAMSSVRSSLGYPPPDFEDIHLGYEETVDNVGGFSPDIVHICIDSWIARKGYIWIFPDDPFGTRVRVGLGIPKSNGESPKDLYESRLLVKYPELKMEPYKCVGGHIPTAPLPETNVHGNVLFVGDAGRFCLPPGHAIMTNPAYVAVEQVQVGQEVLTDTGDFRPVERRLERDYDGLLTKLRPYRLGEPISITPNHPVLAIKPPPCPNNVGQRCYPWHRAVPCRHVWDDISRPMVEWVPAGLLDKGDLVAMPIPRKREGSPWVKLKLKSPHGRHEEYVWETTYADADLCRLVGYYLAEGYVRLPTPPRSRSGVLSFTFNENERKYVRDVQLLLKRFFRARVRVYHYGRIFRIVTCNGAAFRFFHRFGDTSAEKKLADEMTMLPDEHLWQMMRGYWRGDGHRDSEYAFSTTTASRALAYGMLATLLRLKVVPSLKVSYPKKGTVAYTLRIGGWQANIFGHRVIGRRQHRLGRMRRAKDRTKRAWVRVAEINGLFWVPLKEVSTQQYHGKVYNLQVQGDETYTTNGIVVHNCSPLHGGGIGFGTMSGVFAAEAVIAKNPSLYDIKWKQEIAPILKRHYMLKKMLYRWDDKAFNKAVDAVKTFEVKLEGLTNPNEVIMSFMKHLALTHPELIPQFLRIGFYA